MGLKLYEYDELIAEAYERAIDPETGEIIDDVAHELLGQLEAGRDEKIENTLLWYKSIKAEAEAVKAEAKKLTERAKALENRAENIKGFVQRHLYGEKFKTARCSVSYRETDSVEYSGDVEKLPENCIRRTAPEVDKMELKKLLKAGKEIEGATLVKNVSMIVK